MNRTILFVGMLVTTAGSLAAQVTQLDDSTVARLQKVVGDQSMMRVVTIWGPFDLEDPTLTATSVGYGRVLNERLFLPDSVAFPDAVPIDWISQMQIRYRDLQGSMLRTGVLFALVGFALGAVSSPGDTDSPLFTGKQGALGLGALGLLIGAATSSEKWKTIYPEPVAPPSRRARR